MKSIFVLVPMFIIFSYLQLPAGGLIENVDTKGAELREDTVFTIQGREIAFKKNSSIDFYQNEMVLSGTLSGRGFYLPLFFG